MAFTQADLDGLKVAIAGAGNASEIRYTDGSAVKYVSIADAVTLLRLMEDDVRAAAAAASLSAGNRVPPRAIRASFNSGW